MNDQAGTPAGGLAADVIVLADHDERGDGPADRDLARTLATGAQLGHHAPPAIGPAEVTVIDNLGDRIPICDAELDVLEAHLEGVLRDVLGDGAKVQGSKPT